ncbi:MAG TPA: SDR family NAD(P)-dependent oxidoreductase [Gaiellales bacterium]|jgi:NAD(P)-dependent dehydrogenase (short-subunit alcohol dehydrogenase family)
MRVALVTGAATGIGAATADLLERGGLTVARNHLPGQSVPGYSAPADVSDARAVAGMVEQVSGDLGPVAVLVCNAAYMVMGGIEEVGPEEFWRVLDTNLTGSFNCIRACAPRMSASGFGRIVTIASGWGVRGYPRASAYSASKAGVISLTRAVARELGPHGVTANAVAPGVVDTPQLDVDADDAGVSPELIRGRYGKQVALGRVGRPGEVAAVVAHLCGEAAGTITGQVVGVDGGML